MGVRIRSLISVKSLIFLAGLYVFLALAGCSSGGGDKDDNFGTTCIDTDGDGFGQGCESGVDCDDSIATGTGCSSGCVAFFEDVDGDGFGDSTVSITACVAPAGYVENDSDCDCADGSHWSDCGSCTDDDGDGYGQDCDLGTDCDDDPISGPSCYTDCVTFYQDNDGDGRGKLATALDACIQPSGYSANSNDNCDDEIGSHAYNWTVSGCANCDVTDEDGDKYGPDCDQIDCDNNAATGVICHDSCNTYYDDVDGDGYGDIASATEACISPTGFVSNADDCGPLYDYIYPGAAIYENPSDCTKDYDGDGYGDAATDQMFIAGLDCHDGEDFTYPGAATMDSLTECMRDADGDGYGDGSYGMGVTFSVGGDCDDTDASIFPGVVSLGATCIPAGCFEMGDTFNEGHSNELPVHNVCVSAFNMDLHEVTNAEYKECVDAGICAAPFRSDSSTRASYYGNVTYDDYPVIYMDWYRAYAYCSWAGKRLPTEAEWEYAARGGLNGRRFPWGDTIDCSKANYYADPGYFYDENETECSCVGDTSQAGDYTPNGYGLYDMAGNVLEWVNDWYDATYYTERPDPDYDPLGPESGTARVVRSGGAFYKANLARVGWRVGGDPSEEQDYSAGFRCAFSPGQ